MARKEKFELTVLLPDVQNAQDRCVTRLLGLIESRAGVRGAHIVPATDGSAAVCIHFDPGKVGVGEIRQLAEQSGGRVSAKFGHLLFATAPDHARHARVLARKIEGINGVLEASAAPSGSVRIEFDKERIKSAALTEQCVKLGLKPLEASAAFTGERPALRSIGTRSSPHPTDGHEGHSHQKQQGDHKGRSDNQDEEHEHGGLFGRNTELLFAGLSGALLLIGWLSGFFESTPFWVSRSLFISAFIFGGWFTLREAIENIRAKRFEIDSLMLLAAGGAAVLGKWAEGALLLFLFSLGHALEHYAMGRAKKAIEALGKLAPETAVVKRPGGQVEIPIADLLIGDIAIIKPNERIPADGFVVLGESSVDQAPITGESIPVDKRPVKDKEAAAAKFDSIAPEHRVFAGTINQSGALEVEVRKLAQDTTLSRVVRAVSEAETQRSPTQRFTDRFELVFVPAIIAFVIMLLFAPLVIAEPFSTSFYRAMAVLVAASPCALAISTPSAVLSGIARAAKGGVLIKGGAPLETLGTLDAIAFDKTGTLTVGKPRLTDVVPAAGIDEAELLSVSVAVERLSDHPIATAIVRDGVLKVKDRPVLEARDLKSITGQGVRALVGGNRVLIGKEELFSKTEQIPLTEDVKDAVERLKTSGRTIMIVHEGERFLGTLGVMDSPRESAKDTISKLRQLGIRRMIMISGDNQQVASAIAQEVGLDEAVGDMMPDDKVKTIKRLRSEQPVAMVGDGVNDAPAMASATVGIAMGAAASDVALETADVALMADDLAHLPFAVGLSRQTSRIIRQNLWFSLGVVAFLVPATVMGLQMGAAVLLHEGSTLLVVFNALRLLAFRDNLTVKQIS